MSDILSIVGFVVSVSGVILSLLLFNASVNNSRKIILNRAVFLITFDHEILSLFSAATEGSNQNITKDEIKKFNQSMFTLEEMLKNIDIKNKYGIPIMPESDEKTSTNQYKHTYHVNELYDRMSIYFRERNLPDFFLMLNEYDDRCMFFQNYERETEYIRRFVIGPITGIKYVYKPQKEKAKYGKSDILLIKSIKNINDFYEYYDKCYSKFDVPYIAHKQEKTRIIKDIEIITDEENRIPITIYR